MPDSIPDENLENDNEDKKVKIQRSYISLRKYLNVPSLLYISTLKKGCVIFLIQMFRFL